MKVTRQETEVPWLLLTFTLPTKRASQRVQVWRKLQRLGAVALGNSGYLLPNRTTNQERFEWLATAIRKYAGEASVVRVHSIDNLSTPQLVARFAEARGRDYQELIRELQTASRKPNYKRFSGRVNRLRSRFREIVGVDFLHSPLQERVEELLARADGSRPGAKDILKVNPREYRNRTWVTRLRPGIDRSASAWLIRHFIDEKARFVFAEEEHVPREAVPFDMFHGGFGHRGDDCTFETLQKVFNVRDPRVTVIGQIIHDADILDEKFGRKEGFGVDEVLNGWAKQGLSDAILLERGIDLIQALHDSISGK